MGVYIKGMNMPKNKPHDCPLFGGEYGICNADWKRECNNSNIPEDCPLVEVPMPHGRLIDADAMIKEIKRWEDHPNKYIRNRNEDFIFYLNDTETVVESEE